jgi:hypothetical protein
VVSRNDGELRGEVVLGAVPTETTDAVLRIALGEVRGGTCDVLWTVEVSTLRPTGIATRTGSTIDLHAEGITYTEGAERCGSATVIADDESRSTLDRLEEPGDGLVIVDDTGAATTILQVRNHRVVPGRWSTLWVLVGYEGDPGTALTPYLDARSRLVVDVRERPFATVLTWGTQTWMPVELRLRGHRAQRIALSVMPSTVGVWETGEPREMWIRPKR